MAQKYKRNPHPRRRYDITMTISDAPGPLESVEWFAQYEASNCIFTLDSFAGVHAKPEYRMPISYRKLDGSAYIGIVYLDARSDEDYFGESICHWRLTGTTAILKATGAHWEAGFSPYLMSEQVLAQQPVKRYFQRKFYPLVEGIENASISGPPDRSRMSVEITDAELFTITLAPKEVK